MKIRKATLHRRDDALHVLQPLDARFLDALDDLPLRLRDVADIRVGLQTNADEVFIHRDGDVDVEPEATLPVVKASEPNVRRRVIWPYDEDGVLHPEAYLATLWPKAWMHLSNRRVRLLGRDRGTFARDRWHAFGRAVALDSHVGEKLVTPAISARPRFARVPDGTAYYGGYGVHPKTGVDINALEAELNNEDMKRFIEVTAPPKRGGWWSYSRAAIENFPLNGDVTKGADASSIG